MRLISSLSVKRMVDIGKCIFRVLQLTLIRENTITSPCIAPQDLYMKTSPPQDNHKIAPQDLYMKTSKIVLKNLRYVVANTAVILCSKMWMKQSDENIDTCFAGENSC